MPDPKKKAPVISPMEKRYRNAVKVNEAPKQEEGWSKGEVIGTKTYFDKAMKEAKPASGTFGGFKEKEEYKKWLIEQVQGGVKPDELINKGYADASMLPTLQENYKAVYIEKEPVAPSEKQMPINPGFTAQRNFIPETKDLYGIKGYQEVDYADPNAGNSKATRKSFIGNKEIYPLDPLKDFDEKGKPILANIKYKEGSEINKGENLGTIRAQGAVLPQGEVVATGFTETSKPIVTSTPTRLKTGNIPMTNDAINQANLNTLVEKKAKGGLVGKVKGYAKGGLFGSEGALVKDDASKIATATGQAAGLGSNVLENKSYGSTGKQNVGMAAGAAGLGAASKTMGVATALAPMTGGISYALPIAAAGIGAGVGAVKAKENNEDLAWQEKQAKLLEEQARRDAALSQSLNKQFTERKAAYGYKKGGLVQKCADGGEIFDPNSLYIGSATTSFDPNNPEAQMDASLPRWARSRGNITGDGSGMGASTPMFNKGGLIKGKGTGTSDSILAKVEPGSFITPAKNADKAAKVLSYVKGGAINKAPMLKKKADLNQEGGEPVKLSNGEFMFTPEQKDEIVKELGEDVLEMLAPEAEDGESEMAKGGLTFNKAKQILRDGTANGKNLTDKQKRYFGWIAGGGKVGMYKGGEVPKMVDGGEFETPIQKMERLNKEKKNGIVSKKGSEVNPEPQAPADKLGKSKQATTQKKSAPKTAQYLQKKEVLLNTNPSNPEIIDTTEDVSVTEKPQSKKGLTGKQWGDVISTTGNAASAAANFVFPMRQVKMGKEFLAKAGQRPIDTISPDVQDSFNKAKAAAEYGYSPQEMAALEQQNLSALNRQREAARMYAGGGANAYQAERQAIGESFGRGLQSAIASKQLQMSKQSYADQLAAQKGELSRRLFQDNLTAWNQNQQTGAELVNAGLTNAIGAKRYADVLANLKKNQATENSWTNSI
jgi:hypothetical protein